MELTAVENDSGTAPAFSVAAPAVLRQLRAKLSAMLGTLPGGLRKSRDVQRAFGVDARLSWQIFKLAGPGEILALAPHVPGASSMRRLLAAAKEYGIAPPLIEEVRRAFDDFEQLVETHAGDRTSFESMARGYSGEDTVAQADLQHRKAIFKGHSHYYGVQSQAKIVTQIVYPGSAPGLYDCAHIRSRLGQRRLRADADVIVDTVRARASAGAADGLPSWEPLDRAAMEQYHAPILPEFCTKPLPELSLKKRNDGMSLIELTGGAVGQRAAADLVFGQVFRDLPLAPVQYRQGIGIGCQVAITAPTALLIVDVLFHRPTFPRLDLESAVYAYGNASDLQSGFPHLKLPFQERVTYLGQGLDCLLLRAYPRYGELIEYTCAALNWSPDDLAQYRLSIEYPLLGTSPTIVAQLPSDSRG